MYLLCIRGTLTTKDNEAARTTHNATAGNPAGVAAARALGDLSHKVYVPAPGAGEANGAKSGEFLILDVWKTPQGIEKFFSDKNVQEGGGRLLASRDPVVSMPADGAFTFSLLPPMNKPERYVGLMRGVVKNVREAIEVMSSGVKEMLSMTRQRGQLAHELYVKLGPPSTDGSAEIIGVDHWCDLNGMLDTYREHTAAMLPLFKTPPALSVWQQPPGEWVEW
jgi:hypothetical protein